MHILCINVFDPNSMHSGDAGRIQSLFALKEAGVQKRAVIYSFGVRKSGYRLGWRESSYKLVGNEG